MSPQHGKKLVSAISPTAHISEKMRAATAKIHARAKTSTWVTLGWSCGGLKYDNRRHESALQRLCQADQLLADLLQALAQ